MRIVESARHPSRGLAGLGLVLALGLGGATGQGVSAGRGGGDAGRGERLFGEAGCNGCHTVRGTGGQVGPDLTRVASLDLETQRPAGRWSHVEVYLRESIEAPGAYSVPGFERPSRMPSAEVLGLTEQEVDDLVAYLLSLR